MPRISRTLPAILLLGALVSPPPGTTWDLDAVTVTGTRSEKRLADTPVTTEVIGTEEIQASGATDLKDILKAYGVITDESSDHGTQISLDGLSGNRVLILIDGRRVPGRVDQNFEADSLPLTNVSRIEIVRGPQSVLYGSDAMGGVINIITKAPDPQARFSAEVSNTSLPAYDDPDLRGTGVKAAPVRAQEAKLSLDLPLGDFRTVWTVQGARSDFYWDQKAETSILPEGYRASTQVKAETGSPRLGHWTGTLGGTALQETDQTDFTGSLDRRSLQRAEASLSYRIDGLSDDSWEAQASYSAYRRQSSSLTGGTGVWTEAEPDVEHQGSAELWYRRDLSETNLVTLGASVLADSLTDATLDYADHRFNALTGALIVQDEQFQDGLYSVVGGLRLEQSTLGGFFAAPKSSLQYTLGTTGLRLLAGTGLGYRVPSAQDLYTDVDWSWHPIVHGNPDLRPESSWASNLGLEGAWDRTITARVNAYHQELWNEIAYALIGTASDGRAIYQNENRNRTNRTGVDTEASWSPTPFLTLTAAYQWLSAWDWIAGQALTDNPAHRTRGSAQFRWEPWKFATNTSLRWDSERQFAIVDLQVTQDFPAGLQVYARGENLGSSIDAEEGPYTPVSVTLGLRWNQ